jgi:hypothetical protein
MAGLRTARRARRPFRLMAGAGRHTMALPAPARGAGDAPTGGWPPVRLPGHDHGGAGHLPSRSCWPYRLGVRNSRAHSPIADRDQGTDYQDAGTEVLGGVQLRPAATPAAYPEPQAMSSSRVPGPTPARSNSASLARRAFGYPIHHFRGREHATLCQTVPGSLPLRTEPVTRSISRVPPDSARKHHGCI